MFPGFRISCPQQNQFIARNRRPRRHNIVSANATVCASSLVAESRTPETLLTMEVHVSSCSAVIRSTSTPSYVRGCTARAASNSRHAFWLPSEAEFTRSLYIQSEINVDRIGFESNEECLAGLARNCCWSDVCTNNYLSLSTSHLAARSRFRPSRLSVLSSSQLQPVDTCPNCRDGPLR